MNLRLRTELKPAAAPYRLSMHGRMLTLGSCFADAIGRRLATHKFRASVNPFGVIFHPLPALRLLQLALRQEKPAEETYLQHEGLWRNYLLHSEHQAESRNELEERLSHLLIRTREDLLTADALFLTWGTAFLYSLKDTQLQVANCHKQPQQIFRKNLSEPDTLIQAVENFWQELKQLNPNLKLILTVSPVRHLKDGLPLNSVIKSILRYATHQLCERLPDTYYFPAYELLLDDLRDYRFFADDLLHPSHLAEEYIWQSFSETLLDAEAQKMITDWAKLQKALEHRAFQPKSNAYRQHLQRTLQKLEQFPHPLDLSEEIAWVKERLEMNE